MIKKNNKTTIFSKRELRELPVIYRLMNCKKTKDIDELYLNFKYSESRAHFTQYYIVYTSVKPISNFIIKEDER